MTILHDCRPPANLNCLPQDDTKEISLSSITVKRYLFQQCIVIPVHFSLVCHANKKLAEVEKNKYRFSRWDQEMVIPD